MKNILLIGCGHMGGSLLSGWSNDKNYTISVIDRKKYAILKNRNRNKKCGTQGRPKAGVLIRRKAQTHRR